MGDLTGITAAVRVEEIDAAERALLIVALDGDTSARRQIRTWERILELSEVKAKLLGLDRAT